MDKRATYNITYGLYLLTACENGKDNGCIANSVMQLTGEPLQVALSLNKSNYTYEQIVSTGKCNVNILSENAPFSLFQRFGFHQGRNVPLYHQGRFFQH